MANLAQLVNVIAPIFTNAKGIFLQTIYHPLRLYAQYMGEVALDVYIDCDTYALAPEQETSPWLHRVADLGPFKLLEVAATCDTSGHDLTVAVVNLDRERAHAATVQLADGATMTGVAAYEVHGANPEVSNSFEQPEAVTVREQLLEVADHSFTYTFPAHSLTLLRLLVA